MCARVRRADPCVCRRLQRVHDDADRRVATDDRANVDGAHGRSLHLPRERVDARREGANRVRAVKPNPHRPAALWVCSAAGDVGAQRGGRLAVGRLHDDVAALKVRRDEVRHLVVDAALGRAEGDTNVWLVGAHKVEESVTDAAHQHAQPEHLGELQTDEEALGRPLEAALQLNLKVAPAEGILRAHMHSGVADEEKACPFEVIVGYVRRSARPHDDGLHRGGLRRLKAG